ncbi:MAG: hypothetical protein C0467_15525 [Planctomycetaceae bacterium]|nr:hypothetical protein [Planctomycetaceae bacterium]
MNSDEVTIPDPATPVTEPAEHPHSVVESEAAPPVAEAAVETPVPVESPAEAAPAAQSEVPTPKKARKPKAAGDDAASILLGTTAPDEAAAAETTEEVATTETDAEPVAAEQPAAEPTPENKKRWYAVKIQSGREESIKAAIERKVKIEGLEPFFGQIVIPVEELIVKKKVKVKNKKTGETTTQEKNVTKYNKKFPGYLFTEVEFNNDILYVFRETSGVGDFVGVNTKKTAGAVERSAPAPMTDDEVKSMLTGAPDPNKKRGGKGGGKVVVKLDVEKGDKVRIRNGAFMGSEGEVKSITEPKDPTENPKVTVVVTFWGRPVDVEVDYWEVDKI